MPTGTGHRRRRCPSNGAIVMDASHVHDKQHSRAAYLRFAAMLILSFIAMYVLMYAMVDKFEDVYPNHNQAYMAALMTAPMAIIELLLMGSMYPHKRANVAIIVGALVLLAAAWFAIRYQAAIGDEQFVRSMIPHHSGAILMCNGAKLQDAELQQLCTTIAAGQQDEIDRMRAVLGRLGGSS
jgi:uncharacterized protein (DUF305 family)